jgi:hypothetical protein
VVAKNAQERALRFLRTDQDSGAAAGSCCKFQRHREYINALIAHDVAVVESKFMRTNKYCNGYEQYCVRIVGGKVRLDQL